MELLRLKFHLGNALHAKIESFFMSEYLAQLLLLFLENHNLPT